MKNVESTAGNHVGRPTMDWPTVDWPAMRIWRYDAVAFPADLAVLMQMPSLRNMAGHVNLPADEHTANRPLPGHVTDQLSLRICRRSGSEPFVRCRGLPLPARSQVST